MNLINCPHCKEELNEEIEKRNNLVKELHIRHFKCKGCKKKFERHIFLNSLGLVNSDCLYEEHYTNSWKGTE